MTDWNLVSELERANVTVTQCLLELRRAQEDARRGEAVLRRAARGVQEAEEALGEATRRLDRVELSVRMASRRSTVELEIRRNGQRHAISPAERLRTEQLADARAAGSGPAS